MKTLVYFIIALGLLEAFSNLFHLLKINKESIAHSARKQHQELSLSLGHRHFFVKAIIMFAFGILFTLSGLIALFHGNTNAFALVLGLFALYGILQAFYYKFPYKVWMSMVVYILPILIFLFLSGRARAGENPPIDHQTTNCSFLFPFLLGNEPIRRLLVVNFKDDPEYEMIEPQFFHDPIFGDGIRVLLYRWDKKVDVYYQPGVFFDTSKFVLGKGLGYALETEMSPAKFEINDAGVDLDIAFNDYSGRQIMLRIRENSTLNNPFPFLAPVGRDIENPTKLFLVYMRKFDFIKREGTGIEAKVGDRNLVPLNFPMKRNGKSLFFARYASNPTIGEINSKSTVPLIFEPTSEFISFGIHNFSLNPEKNVLEYWIWANNEKLKISFPEGFPNLLSVPNMDSLAGPWTYQVSE